MTDNQFYRQIWEEREHKCKECGRFLGDKLHHLFFSHHLAKGTYGKLRHDPENIDLLCMEHHTQWDFGNKEMMKIYSEERRLKLIQKYYGRTDT